VLILLLMTLLAQTLSGVTAQSAAITTITKLVYPSSNVTAASANVTFDLTYSGLTSAEGMTAAIINSATNEVAGGTASSAPDQCLSLASTQYSDKAACLWRLGSSSGTEHLAFSLQFPGTHIQGYDFQAVATIVTQGGSLLGVSQRNFSILGGTTFQLTVNTAYPVSITIDGASNQPSPAEVTPGIHVVSVPTLVQLDNSSRLRFDHWEDGSSEPNRTLDIESDTTIAATFVPQYLLTLDSGPVNATGAGWYDEGSSAEFAVPSSIPMPGLLGDAGGKFDFKGWYEDGYRVTAGTVGIVNMSESRTLVAQWTGDYGVPVITLLVIAGAVGVSAWVITRRRTTRGKHRKISRRRRTPRRAAQRGARS